MKTKHIIIVLIGLVLVFGIIVAGRLKTQQSGGDQMSAEEIRQTAQATEQQAGVVSMPEASRYTHPTLNFSFEKPEGYTVGSIKADDGSETLIIQSTDSAQIRRGFQIYISALDEPLTLTPQLVQQELPGTTVIDAKAIELDGQGKGMMFTSNSDAFGGKSFEIWFTTRSYLFQVTSYANFAGELQQIIGTWKF